MKWRATNVLVLLTLPAFGAALAPHLPVRHWLIDLPACFPVQAAACLLGTAVLLLLASRRRLAVAWAAGSGLALAAVVPGWFAGPRVGPTTGAPLRLLCLNLLRGNEADAAAVFAAVRSHAPDVVFCSEVTPAWQQVLHEGLRDFPHRCERADPGWFGTALYSRLPLASAQVIPLGYAWAPAIRAVVTTAAGPLGVLGVHAPRPGLGDRCAERDRALAAIPAALAPLPARRLVCGDCNATPWNRSFRDLLAATGLRDAAGGAFRPTWPVHLPWPLRVPIDHVLIPDGIAVERIATGPESGSDHAPLFAALRLPATR